MKKSILLFFFLIFTVSIFADVDFIKYYNQEENWSSGEIGKGDLIINEKVSLDQSVILPNNIRVRIIKGGRLRNNGYRFAIIGDPDNPSDKDPRVIHKKRLRKIITILNYLLLDD